MRRGKGRVRTKESAGQSNNKAKIQNNIILSKNRIKKEKRHNQRIAKQIQKSTVEKNKILPEKLIQDSIVWDTIIVGAGAAGMTAALACGKENQKVLLLDRQNQMGRKILVTGNGKCNLTNFAQKRREYCLCLAKRRQWSYFRVLESIQKIRMDMCIHIASRRQV